jgi:hypothetical protein
MAIIVPPDNRIAGDAGHLTDHTSLSDGFRLSTGLAPSGDTTGATDRAAINSAISTFGGVKLQAGVFWTDQPLLVNSAGGTWVRGTKGGTQSGSGAGSNIGTVIKPVAGWSNPASLPVTGVFTVIFGTGVANTAIDLAIDLRDLWIDGTSGPASLDGVSTWGQMSGQHFEHVGFNKITGDCIHSYLNTNFGSANFGLGVYCNDIICQNGTGWGVVIHTTDGTYVNVHTQQCKAGGIQVISGHNQFIGCRVDLSGFVAGVPQGNHAPGFQIDSVSLGGGFLDAIMIQGGSSQRNDGPSILVTNSSATGNGSRSPVLINGWSADGDWVNGGSGAAAKGAIQVQGRNEVYLSNSFCLESTSDVAGGCPDYGMNTETIGSGPGKPLIVQWESGFINAQVGDILDSATVGDLAQPGPLVTEVIGGQLNTTMAKQFLARLPVARIDFGASGTADARFTRSSAGVINVNDAGAAGNAQVRVTASSSQSATQALMQAICNASADLAYGAQVGADTNNRWRIDSNGQMKWGPGNATQDCTLDRKSANVLELVATDLDIVTAGRGLQIKEGSNARMGTATLNGTTAVVVSNTSITATTRIFLTVQDTVAPLGFPYVSARSASTSFSLKSTNAGDTTVVVAWLLIEPG